MQHALSQPPPGTAPPSGPVEPRSALDDEPDTERTQLPSRLEVLRHHARALMGLFAPTLAVVAMYVALFALDLSSGIDMAVFGVRDAAATERILARYGGLIRREQLRILAAYLVLGVAVGICANLVTLLWERTGTWPPRRPQAWHPDADTGRRDLLLRWSIGRRVCMALGLALGFHLWQLAHAVARFPQLFTEVLHDRGGFRRRLMVLITHVIPPSLVDGLAIGGLLGLLVAPLLSPAGRRLLLWLRGNEGRWLRRAGIAVLAVGAGAWGLLLRSTGTRGAAPQRPQERPSVLLIAVDSLRADRVGPWARHIAPNIAALASRSVRFEAAFVTVPRTFPSFVTLLTGRYPHHHGIRTMFPSAAERAAVGPALPGLLRQIGYQTAVLSDFCGEIFSRIDLGYEQVRVPQFDVKTIVRQRSLMVHPNLLPYLIKGSLGRAYFPALESLAELSDPDLLADRAIAMLDRLGRASKPFFLTVFFSSAHFPYAAPAPYFRRFTDPNYEGPFRYHKPPWADPTTPADIQQVRALYNGAVSATDAAVGRVLRALEERGLDRDTIVVLLADHGENLYDEPGRGMGHGDHLEGAHSQQIPLLIYDPRRRFPPHGVPGVVRDVDLAPTLLALVDGPEAPVPMDGVNLLPLLRGERSSLDLVAFSETELWFTPRGPGFDEDNRLPYPGITATTDVDPSDDIFLADRWRNLVTVAKHRALRTERWKLIYRPTRSGVHWSLFDLRNDPRETRDVAARYPEELARLQAELLRFLAADPHAVVESGYVIPQ
ncbi:MAG: sulfatase-like hydrolase/transferase [Myxococcales bacterium]|nr:sulfatase-like hydrolase/transferase [Myxococcota bacterium]MDW8283860.1 sulfatase-like hydrolase/transferase [Myxococcales bacterium]